MSAKQQQNLKAVYRIYSSFKELESGGFKSGSKLQHPTPCEWHAATPSSTSREGHSEQALGSRSCTTYRYLRCECSYTRAQEEEEKEEEKEEEEEEEEEEDEEEEETEEEEGEEQAEDDEEEEAEEEDEEEDIG